MKTKTIAGALIAALALPALAGAHVTVQPEEVPAGGFTRLDVRVPNETDDAATTKIEVEMPPGFAFASYEPVPGWTTDVQTEKLDQPIQTDDGELDTQVKTITWTADDPSAGIQPGQFRDFGLSVGLPDSAQPGDMLTFPAIQTYDDGEVVRWIGSPDADEPAAQVSITEGAEEADAAPAPTDDDATETAEDDEDSDGAPTWLTILALILGATGVVIGVAGVGVAGAKTTRPRWAGDGIDAR